MATTTKQGDWEGQMEAALDRLSLMWLTDNHPELVNAVSAAVDAGASPWAVRGLVMSRTGRLELALRCQQAAQALVRVND